MIDLLTIRIGCGDWTGRRPLQLLVVELHDVEKIGRCELGDSLGRDTAHGRTWSNAHDQMVAHALPCNSRPHLAERLLGLLDRHPVHRAGAINQEDQVLCRSFRRPIQQIRTQGAVAQWRAALCTCPGTLCPWLELGQLTSLVAT